jgi:hypothetical protein
MSLAFNKVLTEATEIDVGKFVAFNDPWGNAHELIELSKQPALLKTLHSEKL